MQRNIQWGTARALRVAVVLSAICTTAPAERSPLVPQSDGQSLVFEVVPTEADLILFAKGVPVFQHITTHINYGPECTHGGQRWKNLSAYGTHKIVCVFQGHDVSKEGAIGGSVATTASRGPRTYRSHVHSITMQTFRCDHPPLHLQAAYIGRELTLEVDGQLLPTSVNYTGLPRASQKGTGLVPKSAIKPYFLCACMTMWYRTEFLLEWLRYHQLAHGMEKLFLYDNNSGLDFLTDVARMLGSLLPIERVWWPHRPTQLAYMGHCAHRAAQQCEWVTFFDIDEFAYSTKGSGRLADVLRWIKLNEPKVAALELQMIAMSPLNASTAISKPISGVVHNYNCRWKATNVKSVIRPELVHPSLYAGVHFFCYHDRYRKVTLLSSAKTVLYHYKHQAWEVYKRKYQSRASPASKPFDDHVGVLEKPSAKWWKETGFCRAEDHTMHFHTMCALSYRVNHVNCTAQRTAAPLLIVGSGGLGSGMTWMLMALRDAVTGVTSGSSGSGNSDVLVTVDWTMAILRPSQNNTRNPNPLRRYHQIFHLVREPLEAIRAITTYGDREWTIARDLVGFDASYYTNSLTRALHFWLIWSQLIDLVADWHFRVEDAAITDVCDRAGLECTSQNSDTLRRFARTSKPVLLTWAILTALDPNITHLAQEQARLYGYTVPVSQVG